MTIEGLALAVLGGAIGIGAAFLSVPGLTSLLSRGSLLPAAMAVEVDTRVLLFAAAITLVAGVLFSLAPLWRLRGADVHPLVKEGSRASGSHATVHLRSVLIVAEVALSVVLLVSAGLLIRSLAALESVDPGFRAEHVVSMDYSIGSNQRAEQVTDRMLDGIRALPGVRAVGISHTMPLVGLGSATCFWKEGTPAPPIAEQPTTEVTIVSPGYFAAMGIPVLQGRSFTNADRKDAKPVLLINQAMARQFFANQDPVGQALRVCWGKDEPAEIAGVVGDVRTRALNIAPRPMVYFTYNQQASGGGYLVVRTDMEPLAIVSAVKRVVRDVDSNLPLSNIRTLDQSVAESVAKPRFQSRLAGAFSLLALLLAGVGLYGVMAYSVSQRRREIGIRMALGARPGGVAGAVLGQGLGLVALGVAIGMGAALTASRLLETLLYGIAPTDPLTYVGVPLVMLAVSAFASWVPAWRAAHVDPAGVLRDE